MKYLLLFGLFIISNLSLKAQSNASSMTGRVSYVTPQHVYVKFSSTKHISVGDTLYMNQNGEMTPVLVVTGLSSISCVGSPLSSVSLKPGDTLAFIERAKEKPKPEVNVPRETVAVIPPATTKTITASDSVVSGKTTNQQRVEGRLSVSSYSYFSNTPGPNRQRMRYTFSMKADHIGGSKVSAEAYLSFVHSNNTWEAIKKNVMNGLKIYNFTIRYQPVKSVDIWLGRRINPNMSNIGAIDGLQVDKRFKSIIVGAFAGSRPDYTDYSINFNLFQFGAYVGHVYANKQHQEMRTTFAFAEQKNNGATDRRFIYLQHYNSLLKSLYFFATAEMDLYQNINGTKQSVFNLTNLYLMLRYRVVRQLSFSVSYSARHTPVYYETYKDYVQRLIDEETLQGIKFQVNYRPIRKLSLGVRAGYRARKDDPRDSKNLYAWVTYSQVPGIDVAVTLSATILESAYLSGKIYSLDLSRDLVSGKLYAGAGYRYVDYKYSYVEGGLNQHVGDINLTWKIIRKISLSIAYEGVFENSYTYNRIYANLTGRF